MNLNKLKENIKTDRKSARKIYSNQKGITLIALVITIVVLLILAGVSINAIFSENGIINKAKDAQNKMDQATQNDLDAINSLSNWLDSKTNGNTGGGDSGEDNPPTPTEKPVITDSSLISKDRTETESQTVIAQDIKGNQVVVPGGFRIADDSGTSVEQGIVIEDGSGNQFVWVPVSNINADGSNKIKKDNGDEVEITLGRYTFKREKNPTTNLYEDGTATLIQKGSEYAQTTVAQATAKTLDTKYRAGDYYYELSDSRVGIEKNDLTGTNTTAKNLQDFITKTNTNKGFYIARYEASYGSGYDSTQSTKTEKIANAKPLSKVSTKNNTSSMSYTAGTLWNFINQPQAAIVSQNMYKNDNYVESDLVNSYAWNTAIVYIQAMGNSNYANANRDTTGNNTNLINTGETGDQKCKIFDMAGNAMEFTTEYSTNIVSSYAYPCTSSGGSYNDSTGFTSYRNNERTPLNYRYTSFRTILYVK